ncbi:MAG: VOC family protein [Chloroflexota bacterium]|nr:VOC family protein [Chloroflexota bacterium]
MKVLRIHHVTAAVRDLEAARAAFAALLGAGAGPVGAVDAFGVRSADVALGEDTLELVAPADVDNPVMRYIERRGEGFYTLGLEVDDLDAAVAELAGRGVRVSEPVEAAPGVRTAFVTMAATHGLSIQLVEAPRAPEPAPPADAQAWAAPPSWPERPPPAEPPREEAPAPPRPPLDLTPDEWSDVD